MMLQDQVSARFSTGFPSAVLSVSELNRSVKDLLEHRFPLLWVSGEISNFIAAKSGHYYFVLKDAHAQIRCAMFRNRNQNISWLPKDGMRIEVQGLVTLYENRGEFQLIAESMRQAGRGTLFEAFLKLKEKLEKEGLFNAARKRSLPFLPRCIGIVTSAQGAALRDVLATLARRNPSASIVLYPTQVQGEDAAPMIRQAILAAGARHECDVLIVCRGGGSVEDLWAFNDEAVARAISASPMPVVSGVGHETDFTIADFAADVRAPTPTAAAELTSPSRDHLLSNLATLLTGINRLVSRDLDDRAQMIDELSRRLQHPGQRLREHESILQRLMEQMDVAIERRLETQAWSISSALDRLSGYLPRISDLTARADAKLDRLELSMKTMHARESAKIQALMSNLEHLAPQRVLERGYALVRDTAGNLIRDATTLKQGQEIDITLSRGKVSAIVEVPH